MNMTTYAGGDYGFGNQQRGFRPPVIELSKIDQARQIQQQNHMESIDFSVIREDRRNGGGDMTMNTIALFEDFEVMGSNNGPQGYPVQYNYQPNQNNNYG